MVKNIVVTGACGQIAYSLLFMLAQGGLIKTKFNLKLLDIPELLPALEGLKMELQDTASAYLNHIELSTDPNQAFKDGDYFFFLGAFPRGPGMERRDLLEKNAEIFIKQGHALNQASKGAKVLVVGNPCNTNAYILHKKLKRPDMTLTSMSMLDHLRAKSFIAQKLHVSPDEVENLIIWGNHSKSLFVDTHYASYCQKYFEELMKHDWDEALQTHTQKRGEVVIKARGKSSAASAANAALEHMKALIKPSVTFFSCGVYTKNNPYGIDQDLFFSMPCLVNQEGKLEVVSHFDISSYQNRLKSSIDELVEEREVVKHLLNL